jgi:integrating conjugative element protein (TIGR03761 family)
LYVLPVLQRAQSGESIAASDPLFDRYMLYLDRLSQHQVLAVQRQRMAEKRATVTRDEVNQYKSMGKLVNAEDDTDTVVVHTKEAFQLFIGRAADPDSNQAKIVSFKKIGAALRLLWNLSSNNNPYADWALIDLAHRRDALQGELESAVKTLEGELEKLKKRRGIKFSIAENPTPQELPIRFKSPYGYALVSTLAEMDYLVRVVRTMVFKAQLTGELADQIIKDHMRKFRGHFNEIKSFEKYLGDPDLMLLTRNDFLPAADDVARKRVAKCISTFGEVPRNVFNMDVKPPFKSNRSNVSDAEVALLKQVTTGVSDANDEREAKEAEANAQGLL